MLQAPAFGPPIGELAETAGALRDCAPLQRKRRRILRQEALPLERTRRIAGAAARANFDGAKASSRLRAARCVTALPSTSSHQPVTGSAGNENRADQRQSHKE